LSIILKFILTNIKEKKFRTILILISILLSTALFFSSLSVSDSFKNAFVEVLKSQYGKTDIVVAPKDTKVSYVNEKDVLKDKDISDKIGYIESTGAYKYKDEMVTFSLLGTDFEKYKKLNTLSIASKKDFSSFTGNKIIISKYYSKKYKLKLGDTLPLFIKGNVYKFKISAIAYPQGNFSSETMMGMGAAIVPEKTIKNIMKFDGKYSEILLKLKDNADHKAFIKRYSKKVNNCKLSETVDMDSLGSQMTAVTLPFLMITVLVLITSIFIIYTSFKVITIERLPALGTFRSIGATQKKIRRVLLSESLIYGVVGGILAIPVGIGILKIMLKIIAGAIIKGLTIDIYFSNSNIILSFILAVVVSVISAYIPIRRTSKLPVKDIIFGVTERKSKTKVLKIILGFILLTISLIVPNIVPVDNLTTAAGICLFTIVIAFILIVPVIVKLFVFIFEKIYSIFGNEAVLGIKNLRKNNNTTQNITLLSIIISTVVLVFTITSITQSTMSSMYNNINMTCYTAANNLDNNFVNKIKKLGEINNINGALRYFGPVDKLGNSTGIAVKGKKSKIGFIEGIDAESSRIFNFKIKGGYDTKKAVAKLQKYRYILLNDASLKKFDLKVGNSITLNTPTGYKKYKILGETLLAPRDAFISDKYVTKDFKVSKYDLIYINAKHPNKIVKQIKALYGGEYNFTRSIADEKSQNDAIFGAMFGIMKGFAYILLFIGFFGIINNLIINFIQRRRALAMYKSIGMSKVQIVKMFLSEATAVGILGGIIALVISVFEITYIGKILSVTVGAGNVDVNQIIELFIFGFGAAIIITLAGYLVPLFKGSKLEIIEAIKYE
jgi:putative ABC transport system permease protein